LPSILTIQGIERDQERNDFMTLLIILALLDITGKRSELPASLEDRLAYLEKICQGKARVLCRVFCRPAVIIGKSSC